jgi:DNA-binding MarR family transcriptional regulator
MATTRKSRVSQQRSRPTDDLTNALDGIRRVVQMLRASARTAERASGVSGAQLFVLHSLATSPAESLNELAERTYTHQSSVSVVVERLVRRKLVSRTRSPVDARRVMLALTPAGRRILDTAPEIAQVRLISALCSLPRNNLRALARTLEHISEAMGSTAPPPLFFEEHSASRPRKVPRASSRARSRAREPKS